MSSQGYNYTVDKPADETETPAPSDPTGKALTKKKATAKRKPSKKATRRKAASTRGNKGEARIDRLVQTLNAHLNADLEPSEDSSR